MLKAKLNTLKLFLKPKKIVAVSRAFNCEEWLELSIRSVIDHVDKVLVVRSSKPYLDADIEIEDIDPIIETLMREYGNKIEVLRKDWNSEDEQFPDLISYVKNEMNATHFLFIDSDEIYTQEDARALVALTRKPSTFNKALYVDMYTYIKSPFYRVAPMEPYKPLSIFPLVDYLKITKFRHLDGVPRYNTGIAMHHFSLVRKNENRIKAKFETRNTYTRVENWFETFYVNFSESMQNFHPIVGQEEQWKYLEKVQGTDLPNGVAEKYKNWQN